MRHREDRTRQRRKDQQPARNSQTPRPDERQGTQTNQEDEDAREQTGAAERVRILEGAGEPDGPARRLIPAHEHRVRDRPAAGGVCRPSPVAFLRNRRRLSAQRRMPGTTTMPKRCSASLMSFSGIGSLFSTAQSASPASPKRAMPISDPLGSWRRR